MKHKSYNDIFRHYCLFLLILFCQNIMAQRERNYIYLFDCTKSMTGYGSGNPDIWVRTKSYLQNDLAKHTPETSIHIVPFQGKVLTSFSFMAKDLCWKDINKKLDEYVQNVTNTNICEAWDAIGTHIDLHKDNYVILLTDGKDNVRGMDALMTKLKNWCCKYPNTYAFYVLLTENAVDPKIASVINLCDNEFVVDARKGIPVFGSFDKELVIYANTLNLKKIHNFDFSTAGKYEAKAICNDPYFDVKIVGGKIKDGKVSAQISAKQSISQINTTIPQTYDFTFDVQAKGVDIINPTIKVVMTNKPERELEMISEEQNFGEVEWYDSFLFWGAKEPDTLKIDLKAIFNDEAKKDGSSFCVKIADYDGMKDYHLFFNGKDITDGIIKLDAKSMPSNTMLGIVFTSDAKEGKRYFNIKANGHNALECVNGSPANKYEVTVRASYDIKWNPLKIFLFWLFVAIIVALLIWFIILKYVFYPTFKVGSIMVTDPYYSNIIIKGARQIVFSNKRIEQSTLNKIFTGKIITNVNPCWSKPLVMEPANRKKIRVRHTNTYVFDPFSSQLSHRTEYTVENTETNEKIKMTIN